MMYDIAMRFAEEAFGGEYEAVVAVHTDRSHLHAHIIINSVNMVTGYKFQCRDGDWKYKFQPITNKLCEEYGLHITPAEYSKEPTNMLSRPQWEREQTFSEWIRQDVMFCAISAESMEHFIFLLEKLGFEVKQGEHIAVKVPGMKRFKRLDTISEDLSRESLEAMFKYGDANLTAPVNRTASLLPVRKAVLTPYQRKCYARMYRLRLAEKKRFTYKSAYLYEQIRKMHELQEEYLVVVKYDVKSYVELFRLKQRLQRVDEELCKAQQDLYKEHGKQKRACKTEENVATFEASEPEYHEKLEQIKFQKKENHRKLKAVERCLERDGSLAEAEMEYKIPVDDMVDLAEVEKDEVPKNPYRVQEIAEVEETALDEIMEADVIMASENEVVTAMITKRVAETRGIEEEKVCKNGTIVSDVVRFDAVSDEAVKLPSNKADYMRMSVAEKVRCYQFDTKGTDSAFEMVKTYFDSVGISIDFDSVYEEAKLLTDYYEKQKAEEFLQEKTEQIIEKMDMLGIDAERFAEYPADVLSEAFDFGDMEYFAGIKMFNQVLDKLGVDMTHQERYEMFDKIYEEGMREKKDKNNRNFR